MTYAELFKKLRYELKYDREVKTKDHDIQYTVFVDEKKKRIWLAFQATNGIVDWRDNFDFFFQKEPVQLYKDQVSVIRVHRGFKKAYKSAKDQIMFDLTELIIKHPDFEVIITGWSHGGGLSYVAAEDINFRTRPDQKDPNTGLKPIVITYGSPKVFADDVSVQYYRQCVKETIEFADRNDITARVPFGYKKASLCGYIGDKKVNIFKLLNPFKYHCTYADEKTYENMAEAGITYVL